MQEIVQPRACERILDLGCETGSAVRVRPREAEYVGVEGASAWAGGPQFTSNLTWAPYDGDMSTLSSGAIVAA